MRPRLWLALLTSALMLGAALRRPATELVGRELAVAIPVEPLERLRGVLHFVGRDHPIVIGIDRTNDRRRRRAVAAAGLTLLLLLAALRAGASILRGRQGLRRNGTEAEGEEKGGESHGAVLIRLQESASVLSAREPQWEIL